MAEMDDGEFPQTPSPPAASCNPLGGLWKGPGQASSRGLQGSQELVLERGFEGFAGFAGFPGGPGAWRVSGPCGS